MKEATSSISVVVPIYNSEETIVELVERLHKVLLQIASEFEVILVNDNSRDGSWPLIQQMVDVYPFVRAINLMRNYGQHNALLAGIRAADFEIIVTLDDDLQNPPEEIPVLVNKLGQGYDVVYGTPDQEQHGLLRDLASRFTKLTLKVSMGVETASKVSAFRAFRTEIRQAFSSFHGPFLSIDVLLTWGTTNFSYETVKHEQRKFGRTNYSITKLIFHAMNMVTGFSVLPLQIASMTGFFFTFFGFLVLIYILVRFLLEGNPVQGFPFLASIIAIFAGAQLFAVGIIGEYLARMHFRIMEKPTYIIRSKIGGNQSTADPKGAA